MAVIKLKNKLSIKWQVKIRGSDKNWITQTFDRKSDAEAYERNLKQKIHSGEVVSNLVNQITVEDFFLQWHQDRANNGVTGGWRHSQFQMYRDYIGPEIGNFKLKKVTPVAISRVLQKASDLGRSEQTRVHIYNLLHKMFDDAIELYEFIEKNPVRKKLKPKIPKKESKHLDFEEAVRLLEYVRDRPYGIAIWLSLLTGLRVGEIQALKWSCVDLTKGYIQVRSTYARKEKIFRDYPKGKKWHRVKIPDELLMELKKHRLSSQGEFVVMSLNGRSFLSYQTYFKALKRYCKEARVPVVSTHGLRHSTAEVYMRFGASRDDLRILFDHSSGDVTDTYIHDKGSSLDRVAEVIQIFPKSRVDQNVSSSNVP